MDRERVFDLMATINSCLSELCMNGYTPKMISPGAIVCDEPEDIPI